MKVTVRQMVEALQKQDQDKDFVIRVASDGGYYSDWVPHMPTDYGDVVATQSFMPKEMINEAKSG